MKLDESTTRLHLVTIRQILTPRILFTKRLRSWSWIHDTGTHSCPMSIPPTHYCDCNTAISKFDHGNPWSRPCVWWKVNVTLLAQQATDLLPFVSHQSALPSLRYSYLKIWPWKSKVKVIAMVKPIGHIWDLAFNWYVHISFCVDLPIWQRYSKLHIWPCKFKVKVMTKVKPDGHIWGTKFNRYICFSSPGNQTVFGWDIANSIFYLENPRSWSWPRSNPMVTFET